jgi:FlgN protein
MHSHQKSTPLTNSFLQRLDVEERLLNDALTVASDLYETLRKGDLAPVKLAQPRQEELAAALRSAAAEREAASIRLARSLGMPTESLTLAKLANRLGEPQAAGILAVRDRLSALTTRLADFQQRNANLIHHLRSYFRSVLSALTKTEDVPIRYGSSGVCLNRGFGAAIRARG